MYKVGVNVLAIKKISFFLLSLENCASFANLAQKSAYIQKHI
jgi:hypothetical protein